MKNIIIALIAFLISTNGRAEVFHVMPLSNTNEEASDVCTFITEETDIDPLQTNWNIEFTTHEKIPYLLVAKSEPQNWRYWVIVGPNVGARHGLDKSFNGEFKTKNPGKYFQVCHEFSAQDESLQYKLLQELVSKGGDILMQAFAVSKNVGKATFTSDITSPCLKTIAKVYGVATAQRVAGKVVDDLEKNQREK